MTAFVLATPNGTNSVLCTTFHGLINNQGWGFANSAMRNVEVFYQRDPTEQRMNLWEEFVDLSIDEDDMGERGFERLKIVEEPLKERVNYLKELKEKNELETYFLDPEFQLYARPLLDVVFLTTPVAIQNAITAGDIRPFVTSPTRPKSNDPFCAIAFHDHNETYDDNIYASTIASGAPRKASDFVYPGRSCTLGRTCSNAAVFAINFVSYFDKPLADPAIPSLLGNSPGQDADGTPEDPLAGLVLACKRVRTQPPPCRAIET
ncbi:hypothetical protein HK097_009301 [Rhizophlyctis rosea]|uniref:Uncharacterized protein n=1 Tax=Rhizophlyctis rosea TaxID=64517 RepID=A0AAD5SAR6_9FUNG|nr:hypothetical protein HK097_009301 [Rhizophlyctis rosea]